MATSNVPDEEVFGPLLGCVWRYDDFESAIEMANSTRYGLSSGLDIAASREFDQLLLEARRDRELEQTADRCGEHRAVWWRRASGNHRASAWYAADYCAWPMASLKPRR